MNGAAQQLLVTTSHSLLLVDIHSARQQVIQRGQGLYFGLAPHRERLYLAARNRLVSSEVPRDQERGEILVLDGQLQLVERLTAPFPLRDLHGIAWHGDRLFLTCSFDNLIAIYQGGEWQRWYPLGEGSGEHRDRNHFNTLRFEGEEGLLLAHNWGESEVIQFDPLTLEVTARRKLGRCAHDLWREQGQLFTCSSGEGRIRGDRGFDLEVGGFPRGVARIGGERCIGISELAERDQRDLTTGYIKVFDHEWRLKRVVTLPGEGLVLDMLPWPMGADGA